jgi:HTH-type transcriptional repressor of NAD biosynthesis genes
MVCSDTTQPIKGILRYNWLRTIYKDVPNVNIIWCRDENPQYPSEANSVDEFYNKYWVPSVYKFIKELDVVFTSEDYGDEFASYLGVEHVQVDQPRTTYAVSGTAVRTNPLANWHFIPDIIKSYYTKRVAILGPESTGKSTLVENLARHFNGIAMEEYGRTYTAIHGTKNLTVNDFINIGIGHRQRLNEALKRTTKKYCFIDTEAIITKTFGKLYMDPDFNPSMLDSLIKAQQFDLYLVMNIDVPWVDDGTRDFPDKRKEHFDLIIKELEVHNIPYVVISGSDYEERTQKSINEVEKLV